MLAVKCLERSLAHHAHALHVSWLYGLGDQMTPSWRWAPVAWLPKVSWSGWCTSRCQATSWDWFFWRRAVPCPRAHSSVAKPWGPSSDSPFWPCQSSIQQLSVPQVLQAFWLCWIRGQRFLDHLKACSHFRPPSKLAASQITKDMSWNSTSKSSLQNPKSSACSTPLYAVSNSQV